MNISIKTILNGANYFHPRAVIIKDKLLMTMQAINGSDYFGAMQYSTSDDKGESWTKPEFIPGMGCIPVSEKTEEGISRVVPEFIPEIKEGICDVVSDYHPTSGKVIAIGHNVYYKDNRFYDSIGDFHPSESALKRFPVYTVQDSQGKWTGKRKKLHFPEFEEYSIYSCNCAQKIILPDGKMLIPITFGDYCRRVTSFLCDFDGENLSVIKRGNILENSVKRGLIEPSIVEYQDNFYMTMRAEDERGYLSVSDNGLNWSLIKSWQWDDGTFLTMGSTQQHWLKLGGKLYLVYTRKTKENTKVMRWRAPVFRAEVDTQKLCLIKDTEQVVLPMRGDPEKPETIGMMGNFHPLALSETEAIVTVGEMHPRMNYSGETLLARLKS
jgi:hypothetical protein